MKINFTNLFLINYFYILILEFLFKFFVIKTGGVGFFYIAIFTLFISVIITFIMSLFKNKKVNKIISFLIWIIIFFVFSAETIYYSFYKTICGIEGLRYMDQAEDFTYAIVDHVIANRFVLIGYIIPLIALLVFFLRKKTVIEKGKLYIFGGLLLASASMCITSARITFDVPKSTYDILYKSNDLYESTNRLGLSSAFLTNTFKVITNFKESFNYNYFNEFSLNEDTLYNVTDIDFDSLIENESDEVIKSMYKYFSVQKPTNQNEYTGIFAGKNLIFITAEGFYPFAVNEKYTPTLYKLANSSFIFNNYYQPIYNCSTSDGEFTNLLSLLPGVSTCSMTSTIGVDLPFAPGNILKDYKYDTYGFHGWTFNYYKRDLTYPNLGFNYYGYDRNHKGYDKPLTGITDQWPTSDIDVINSSFPIYSDSDRFLAYYMSISGHLAYNFGGNAMANKNKSLVSDMNAGDAIKAYMATQIEFDRSLELLINKLEEKGILDDTVLVIAPDHYPYGLTFDQIREYDPSISNENFDLYKNTLIIYNPSIEGVKVDKYVSSIDILPTLLNMFGITYDSRLLMGNDVFSDEEGLVIFNNKSWITDKGRYNYSGNTAESFSDEELTADYIDRINNLVDLKFKMSKLIISNDFYRKVFGD